MNFFISGFSSGCHQFRISWNFLELLQATISNLKLIFLILFIPDHNLIILVWEIPFMEDCLKLIYTRRSVRGYGEGEISDGDMNKILRAAMQAPSAGNEQPWHFVVVKNRENLKKLASLHPYGKMLENAAAAIVVCADEKLSRYPFEMWVQDCSAATQNILLAARILGIGSCWLGVYPRKERMEPIAEFLQLPDHVKVFCIVSLGYPKSENDFYEAGDRFKPERIHLEKW
jgi:nitroreductase